MENKLHTGKSKFLSYGGCLILLRSSMCNVSLYMLCVFELPRGPEKRWDIFRKCFLWLDKEGISKYHLVKCDMICLPQDHSGLGLIDLRVMNFCLYVNRYETEAVWTRRYHSEPADRLTESPYAIFFLVDDDRTRHDWIRSAHERSVQKEYFCLIFEVRLAIKETLSGNSTCWCGFRFHRMDTLHTWP
jgi:hypothetical protein